MPSHAVEVDVPAVGVHPAVQNQPGVHLLCWMGLQQHHRFHWTGETLSERRSDDSERHGQASGEFAPDD